ncbi:MAG: hypothetical protein IPG92_07045 [Flavobacteriales bacterium]|nr:hypothetical protein [Flavobacteriales bacterium]
MTISTAAGSLTDMAMEVYSFTGTACAPTLTPVGCAIGNGASLMPRILVAGVGTNGNVYLVRIWSQVSVFGTFSICAYENFPPPNNEPCGAIALPVSTGCVFPPPFTTENATQTLVPGLPGCVGAAPVDDVWFTAVVPASGQLQIDTDNGVLTDATIAVYTGTCGSLTLVAGKLPISRKW